MTYTNPNVQRINSATVAAGDAIIAAYYSLEEPTTDEATGLVVLPSRITVVPDPTGQRDHVCRITLNTGDNKIAASYRSEISRDAITGEYALESVNGGGWIWFSYMLDPEWLAKYHLITRVVDSSPDYTINIQQFKPSNSDPASRPPWSIVVNESGVSLRKWRYTNVNYQYDLVATWPVDSLVWHDLVAYVYWSTDRDGIFALYKDDVLIYKHLGPNVYEGFTHGCWWKAGIYAPGAYPTGIDSLTMYTQGYKQVYHGGSYNECRGVNVTTPPPARLTGKLF